MASSVHAAMAFLTLRLYVAFQKKKLKKKEKKKENEEKKKKKKKKKKKVRGAPPYDTCSVRLAVRPVLTVARHLIRRRLRPTSRPNRGGCSRMQSLNESKGNVL